MGETIPQYGLHVQKDPEYTRFTTGCDVQRITVNDEFILVEDPWLGDYIVPGGFGYDFYTTAAFLRSTGVSQLCKSRESSTIPNLANFDRGWGVIAQYRLVEHFARQQGLTGEHAVAIHLATQGDDQGHTAFSHQLELAVQKWNGPQDYHETVWPKVAKLGGVTSALDKLGIKYTDDIKVSGFDIPDWAHAVEREDIDIDRLQYIAAEALLWFDTEATDPRVRHKVREALKLDNYEITENGKLAVKNPESALVLSKLLLLFASEHYNDPLNRVHLHLGIHAVQHTIKQRRLEWMDSIDCGQTRMPTEYFHAVDADFNDALQTGAGKADTFIYLISTVLNASGAEERRRFLDYRLGYYSSFVLDDEAVNFPSEYLEPKRVEFGPHSSQVHTEVVDLTDEQREHLAGERIPRLDDDSGRELSYTAISLKNRYIDPLVKVGNGHKRLSEVRPSYAALLAEHQALQKMAVRVSFAFSPDYAAAFRTSIAANDHAFGSLQNGEPMTPDQFRRMLEIGARRTLDTHLASGRIALKGNALEAFLERTTRTS